MDGVTDYMARPGDMDDYVLKYARLVNDSNQCDGWKRLRGGDFWKISRGRGMWAALRRSRRSPSPLVAARVGEVDLRDDCLAYA